MKEKSLIDYFFKENNISYEREYKFHPNRKWKFDFAIPDQKIAIEIEGAIYTQGRHTRGAGYQKDCEKYREAVILGWHLLRYTTNEINENPNRIVEDIKRLEELVWNQL